MHRIERAGIVVVMRLADLALEFHASPIGQIGENSGRMLRMARAESETCARAPGASSTVKRSRSAATRAGSTTQPSKMAGTLSANTQSRRTVRGASRDARRAGENKRAKQEAANDRCATIRLNIRPAQASAMAAAARHTAPESEVLFACDRYARGYRSERQQKRLMKAHMALVAMRAGISQ